MFLLNPLLILTFVLLGGGSPAYRVTTDTPSLGASSEGFLKHDATIDAEDNGADDQIPFQFGYQHDDGHGTMQHREESSDSSGVVRGSYGYRDPFGIYRHVSYVATADGFRAVLRTNEPGVLNRNSANVAVVALSPPPLTTRDNHKYEENSAGLENKYRKNDIS